MAKSGHRCPSWHGILRDGTWHYTSRLCSSVQTEMRDIMGNGLGHWCMARSSCISQPFRKSFSCNCTCSYMKWHCCFPFLSAVPLTHLARKIHKDQHQPAKVTMANLWMNNIPTFAPGLNETFLSIFRIVNSTCFPTWFRISRSLHFFSHSQHSIESSAFNFVTVRWAGLVCHTARMQQTVLTSRDVRQFRVE